MCGKHDGHDTRTISKYLRDTHQPSDRVVRLGCSFLSSCLQMRCSDPIISKLIQSQIPDRLYNNQSKAFGWMLLPHDGEYSSAAWIQTEPQDWTVCTWSDIRGPPPLWAEDQGVLLLQSVPDGLSPFLTVCLRGCSLHLSWGQLLVHIQARHAPT